MFVRDSISCACVSRAALLFEFLAIHKALIAHGSARRLSVSVCCDVCSGLVNTSLARLAKSKAKNKVEQALVHGKLLARKAKSTGCMDVNTVSFTRAPNIALLLAGQIRSFSERLLQRDTHAHFVQALSAAVFAHLSFEHSYAPWHKLIVNESSANEQLRISSSIRRLFRPVYFQTLTDAEVMKSSSWVGRASGATSEQSVLFLRWLLLLEAMRSDERVRGSRYGLVLRMRPDATFLCKLPSDLPRWMNGFDAVQEGDQVMLMTREAASVALSVYLHGPQSAPCRLKVELCVPAVLSAHNLSVANMGQPGAALVRPEAFCVHAASVAMLQHDPKLSCGRTFLGATHKPLCRDPPRAWNLSARLTYWSSDARAARRAAARGSTDSQGMARSVRSHE